MKDRVEAYKEAITNYAIQKGIISSSEEIKFTFYDGEVGMEDMTFPSWFIEIPKLGAKEFFADQIRYRRNFGQCWFIDAECNRKIVYDWIDNLTSKEA